MFGAGQSSYDDEAVVGNEDGSSVVGFANYTMGPITAGVTMSDSNNTRSATAVNTNDRWKRSRSLRYCICS